MKKFRKIFTGAGMLAFCMTLSKLIGALYRIPLTNILGAEGMGIYYMVFPLYTVLLTISSGGIPVAISRLVAVKQANSDEKGGKEILSVSIVVFAVIGVACTLLLLFSRNIIASVQGNIKSSAAYAGISPAILLVVLLACFRGYFQGKQNMFPSSVSQIIEQSVKLFVGLYLAGRMSVYGLEYAVLGALLGITISEFAALAVIFIMYIFSENSIRRRKKIKQKRTVLYERSDELAPLENVINSSKIIGKSSVKSRDVKGKFSIIKEILRIAVPVTLGSLILPLTQVIDSVMTVNLLVLNGVTRETATAYYGIFNGTVMTVINMPIVVISSLSVALMPRIAALLERGEDTRFEIGFNMKLVSFIALPMFLFILVFSKEIITLLFSRGLTGADIALAASLLRAGSVIILVMGITQISTAAIQGHNHAGVPVRNLLIGAAVKVVLSAVLLNFIGIYGAIAGTVACYITATILDIISLKKYSKFSFSIKPILKLLLAGVAFFTVLMIFKLFVQIHVALNLLVALSIGIIIYIALILIFVYFNANEKQRLPLRIFKKTKKVRQSNQDIRQDVD